MNSILLTKLCHLGSAVKGKMWHATLLLLACMALGGVTFPSTPPIAWTPATVTRIVSPGLVTHEHVRLRSTEPLTGVALKVVPELASVVSFSPSQFSSVRPGFDYLVELTIAVPSSAQTSVTIAGAIRVVLGRTTIAKPLAVNLDIEVSSFKAIDPTKLVMASDGSVFPVNQAIARLDPSASALDAQLIALSLGGDLVGLAASSNSWEIEIPAGSQAALEDALSRLIQNPLVIAAFPNHLGRFFVTTDLTSLSMCDPNDGNPLIRRVQAYDQVSVQQAWDLIESRSVQSSPVVVGIIDWGMVSSHPEFAGVMFVANPLNATSLFSTFPGSDHGTSVAGIIGANNAGIGELPLSEECAGNNGLQMTGILGGTPNLHYSLDVVGRAVFDGLVPFFPDYDLLTYIDNLGGTPAVNISFGYTKCSVAQSIGCIGDTFFDSYKQALLAHIRNFQSSLFLVAAGNDGIDVSAVLPAALGTEPNVLTVGGSDPASDLRAIFTNPAGSSNFGSALGLAAPAKVWAPNFSFLGLLPSWNFFTGTSASAPMVTGAAGILQALGVGSPANLKYYLTASGDPITTTDNKPIGGRRLNVFCAVQLLLPPPPGLLMDDNFSEGYRDCSRWFTTVEPPGIGTITANQELDMTKVSSGNGYMGLASRCKLSGDFDVQVGYSLPLWPAQNSHTVRLVASDLPDGGTGLPGVYRDSYADEDYQFRNQLGVAGLVSKPTSDRVGTMRLTRTGTSTQAMLSAYDANGIIGSPAPTTSSPTGFTIDFATPSTTAPGDVAIAFDNFKVNAGTVTCP